MTFEFGKSRLLVPALLAASIGLAGCGGGGGSGGGGGGSGGGGGDTPATGITVTPDLYDFGVITEGNLDRTSPQEFVIRNEEARSYDISSMSLFGSDPGAFFLDDSGGNDPCGAPRLTSPLATAAPLRSNLTHRGSTRSTPC